MTTKAENTRTILITGFEPFDGAKVNPSWEAVSRLPESIDGWTLIKEKLPVRYLLAGRRVLELSGRYRPGLVICTGLAGGRTAVTPEMIAVNRRDARIPDNAGKMADGESVVPEGPDGIFTALPAKKLVEKLNESGIPAALSWTAGTFVCNDVFYQVLYALKESGVPCGFIHVPGEDALSVPRCTEALRICIRACVEAPAASSGGNQ